MTVQDKSNQIKSSSDIDGLRNMAEDEIDYSDIPPLTEEWFDNAFLRKGLKPFPRKNQEMIPINIEIIEYFKSRHFNYPKALNDVLVDFIEKAGSKDE